MKRSFQIKTQNFIKTGKDEVTTDPKLLFVRAF